MQQSQRAIDNHALEYAAAKANELNIPLLVFFCVVSDFPDANARHYVFMLQGLRSVARALADRGIVFMLMTGDAPAAAISLSCRARLMVTDMGYLRLQRQWRQKLARETDCPIVQVESDTTSKVYIATINVELAQILRC